MMLRKARHVCYFSILFIVLYLSASIMGNAEEAISKVALPVSPQSFENLSSVFIVEEQALEIYSLSIDIHTGECCLVRGGSIDETNIINRFVASADQVSMIRPLLRSFELETLTPQLSESMSEYGYLIRIAMPDQVYQIDTRFVEDKETRETIRDLVEELMLILTYQLE